MENENKKKRIFWLIFFALWIFVGTASAQNYKIWYSANDGSPNWRIMSVNISSGKEGERRVAIDLGPGGSLDSAQAFGQTVVKEKEGYTMYYSGNDGRNWRILRATSSDGLNWQKMGIALNLGEPGAFDCVHMLYPYVIKEDDKIYKIWYTALDQRKRFRIGYAESEDGVIFKKRQPVLETGQPGGLDGEHAHTPVILKSGGIYYMYYAGFGGYPPAWRILYATSLDGINWRKQGLVLDIGKAGEDDSANLLPASVTYSGGLFKMWYWGQGVYWKILQAISDNGVDWVKNGAALKLGEGRALDSRGMAVAAVIEE